jgi:hypothetical protein
MNDYYRCFVQIARRSEHRHRGDAYVCFLLNDVSNEEVLCSFPHGFETEHSPQYKENDFLCVQVVNCIHTSHVLVRGTGWRLFDCQYAIVGVEGVLPQRMFDVERALAVLAGWTVNQFDAFWFTPPDASPSVELSESEQLELQHILKQLEQTPASRDFLLLSNAVYGFVDSVDS